MPFTPYIDTLGQSAFDFLVDEGLRYLQGEEFYLDDLNEEWVEYVLPDFYLEGGWDDLNEAQQHQVLVDVRDAILN